MWVLYTNDKSQFKTANLLIKYNLTKTLTLIGEQVKAITNKCYSLSSIFSCIWSITLSIRNLCGLKINYFVELSELAAGALGKPLLIGSEQENAEVHNNNI